ncbi:MAG: hypothetical protein HOV81_41770 [Kofleriaceae bacterium]|nr:hypothetical protein [Kofleriaceae bacterium]
MAANDPAHAAEMYELADELAPSAPALRNAARARLAAGHIATAATLAAQLLQRYSNDKESRSVAEAILSDLAPRLTQLEIACSEECTLALDGKAASSTKPRMNHVLYVQPGARTLTATFDGDREAKAQVTAVAGKSKQVQLDAPAKPEKAAPVAIEPAPVTTAPVAPAVTDTRERSHGIGRKWFVIAAGATAGLGVAATLRGLSTLDTRDAIKDATAMGDDATARSLYDKGKSQQLQTNILIGATAAVGATAIVLAVLADWSPHKEAPAVSVSPTSGGATVVFGGSF